MYDIYFVFHVPQILSLFYYMKLSQIFVVLMQT